MKRVIAYATMLICLFVLSPAAMAQATRTWVSGVGDDANPCSRTAPCKTFAGAISKTAAGGEIDALDPGGFGTVTITKAITIDGGGTFASTLASGVQGFVVSAGAGDTVVLRNLSINGAGTTLGTNGINYISGGNLIVENCLISRFSGNAVRASLTAAGNLVVTNVTMTQIGTGAVSITTSAGTLFSSFSKLHISNSANGIVVKSGVVADISDSTLTAISGTGLFVQAGVLTASRNTISNGAGTAVLPQGGVVRLTANNIYNNATAIGAGAGQVGTSGNNNLAGNGASSVSPTFTSF